MAKEIELKPGWLAEQLEYERGIHLGSVHYKQLWKDLAKHKGLHHSNELLTITAQDLFEVFQMRSKRRLKQYGY